MRVLPAPGPGRGRRGAEGAAAGVPAPRGRRSRLRPALDQSQGAQTRLPGPGAPRGAAFSRRDVTVWLFLRRGATSVSGYPSNFAQVSRPTAHSNARAPHTTSGPGQPRALRRRLLAEAASSAVLLRLLASRLCSPPPPPRLLFYSPAPSSAPKARPPSLCQTDDSRSESDRRLRAKSSASSFWKSNYTASRSCEGPMPAAWAWPLQPREALARESQRPPPPPAGRERRVTPRSRATRQKKRRARRVPGRPAPSPPPIHKPLRGRALELQGGPMVAFVFCAAASGLGGSRKGRAREPERRSLQRSGRIPEGRGRGLGRKS